MVQLVSQLNDPFSELMIIIRSEKLNEYESRILSTWKKNICGTFGYTLFTDILLIFMEV